MSSCEETVDVVVEGPRDLDSLIIQFPDSVELLIERGNKLLDSYQYDMAMNDAAKAFRIDSNKINSRLLYAEVLNNRSLCV
jgi:hypothetical protein